MTDQLPTEIETLKARAKQMNITHSANIGVDALRKKVNAKINGEPDVVDTPQEQNARKVVHANPDAPVDHNKYQEPIETPTQWRRRKRQEANRLVRVNVMNRNPAMKDYEGDWYFVSNSVVGDIKKFVQYDTENGFHVPYMIYLHLKEKEYQVFQKKKNSKGKEIIVGKNVKELSVELLDPLTNAEIDDLVVKQALNKSID